MVFASHGSGLDGLGRRLRNRNSLGKAWIYKEVDKRNLVYHFNLEWEGFRGS